MFRLAYQNWVAKLHIILIIYIHNTILLKITRHIADQIQHVDDQNALLSFKSSDGKGNFGELKTDIRIHLKLSLIWQYNR